MKRNIQIYFKDILENMLLAENMVQNIDFDRFVEDKHIHYVVIRCVEIVGEASKHIPMDIQKKYPDIPWKNMAGMRDKLIHDYMGIDFEIVWLTVKEDFPSLRPQMERILAEIQD